MGSSATLGLLKYLVTLVWWVELNYFNVSLQLWCETNNKKKGSNKMPCDKSLVTSDKKENFHLWVQIRTIVKILNLYIMLSCTHL